MNDNGIVYQAHLHWVLFFWPGVLFCIGGYIGLQFNSLHLLAIFFEVFALIWGLIAWAQYHFSSLTIKNKQIILCMGVLVQKTVDIPLNKIESIDITRSLIGSLLQYGTLVIRGTGGTRQVIPYLNKPLTCRRYIEQLLHD